MAETQHCTIGNENEITCPICGATMRDLWDVDPSHSHVNLHCEACDGLLAITDIGGGEWVVTIQ